MLFQEECPLIKAYPTDLKPKLSSMRWNKNLQFMTSQSKNVNQGVWRRKDNKQMKTQKYYRLNASSRIRYQDLLENRQLGSFLVSVFLTGKVHYFLGNWAITRTIRTEIRCLVLFSPFINKPSKYYEEEKRLPSHHSHQQTTSRFWLLPWRKTF